MSRLAVSLLAVAVVAAAPTIAGAQPPADLLVVLEKDSAAARLIDVNSGATLARLPTGPFPHEVAASPDGAWAVVADYGAQQPGRTLTVLDLRGRRVARTIDLGEYRRPHGIMWLDGPGQRVAVTAEGSQALLVVDVAAGRVERAVATGQQGTHMVALAPGGTRAWTANMQSGSVSRVDLGAGTVARTAVTGRTPEAIDVSPDGREVWTADRNLQRITVLDATTLDSLASIPTGRFPNRLKFTPDGRTVLVSNAADGTLGVYDARARRLVAALQLGEGRPAQAGDMNPTGRGPVPLGIQLAPDGRRAWVALNSAGAVAEVGLTPGDPSATRMGRRVEAGAGPDGMAYAPGARMEPPPPSSAPEAASTAPPFVGTRWVLVRVGDQRVVTPTDDPRRVPHLIFDSQSARATGSGGCNRLAGPYRRQGEALTVGPMIGTRMACPDVMATEAAFTAALERVRGWRVVDGRLELLDGVGAAGQVVAAFTPAPTSR